MSGLSHRVAICFQKLLPIRSHSIEMLSVYELLKGEALYQLHLKLSVDDLLLLTLLRLNGLLGNTQEHLRTYVQEPSARHSMYTMHTAQAQPPLEGDKPVCTHATQCVTKPCRQYTRCGRRSWESQQAEWAFFCQRRTFSVGRWMMEKKGLGWRVQS